MIPVTIIGNIGAIDTKRVGDHDVLEIRVAVDIGRGERKKTVWFRCTLWGNYARVMHEHVAVSQRVVVIGEITMIDAYDGKEGVTPSVDIRVNQLSIFNGNGDGNGGGNGGGGRNQTYSKSGGGTQGDSWGGGGNQGGSTGSWG